MIHIAIPAMGEYKFILPLLNDIWQQTYHKFKIYICVNQPDHWWNDLEKKEVCLDNQKTLKLLSLYPEIEVLDRSSLSQGWQGKKKGVGWARKELMDRIVEVALDSDIILSLDADCRLKTDYLEKIAILYSTMPNLNCGACSQYFHQYHGDSNIQSASCRYEIYMRYYAIMLHQINSPYAFTALGSTLSLFVKFYKVIGGIKPRFSGEDFYLAMKIVKKGRLYFLADSCVFPSARVSWRVGFGTGPAIEKLLGNQNDSYPFFNVEYFDMIRETMELFPKLYERDIITPLDNLLKKMFGDQEIWMKLRKNYKNYKDFKKAAHEKLDGLRILQILRELHQNNNFSNRGEKNVEEVLIDNNLFKMITNSWQGIRDGLQFIERKYQQQKKYLSLEE